MAVNPAVLTSIFLRLEFQISTHIFCDSIFVSRRLEFQISARFLPRHLITIISFVNLYYANFYLFFLQTLTCVLCFSTVFFFIDFVFVRNGTPNTTATQKHD